MCLGIPGQVLEVNGRTALVDFWGTKKTVEVASMTEPLVPGDYIISHAGCAIRKINDADIQDTLGLYEVLLAEAGEDPLAMDVAQELSEADVLELVTV